MAAPRIMNRLFLGDVGTGKQPLHWPQQQSPSTQAAVMVFTLSSCSAVRLKNWAKAPCSLLCRNYVALLRASYL